MIARKLENATGTVKSHATEEQICSYRKNGFVNKNISVTAAGSTHKADYFTFDNTMMSKRPAVCMNLRGL